MKKNHYFLLLLLIICQGRLSLIAQESVVVPVEGQYYSIQHECGLYLTRSMVADNPKICNPSGNLDQVFVFEPVEGEAGTYYIKNQFSDEYMVVGDGNVWDMIWVADLAFVSNLDKGKYKIVTIEGNANYIQIKNLDSQRLAPDGITDNTTVYVDKSESNLKNGGTLQWKIKVYSTDVDKAALQAKIEEAIAFFDSTVQGNLPNQYPALTYNTLAEVISHAEDVFYDEMSSQAEVNNALMALTEALNLYKDSVNPYQPDTNATYYIIHFVSGAYMGDGSVTGDTDNIGVADPVYSPDQQFRFVAVSGQTAVYNIKLVSTGKYITRNTDNGWNLHWADDPNTDLAQFQLKSTGTGYYLIKCMRVTSGEGSNVRSNNTMGTDFPSGTDRRVYIDKDPNDAKTYWAIQDITIQGIVKTALQAALDKVSDFFEYAVRGDGPDQYPAAEYDALIAQKAIAEAVLADVNATQNDVNEAVIALNDVLAACIAAVNPFFPDITKNYNLIHSSGLYLGEYSDVEANVENGIAIFSGPIMDNLTQQFQFVAVDGAPDVYNIKILSLEKYLTRVSDPPADDYKLVWGSDPVIEYAQFVIKKAGVQDYYTIRFITPGPQRSNSCIGTDNTTEFSGVYADKNGTNNLHYWNITLAPIIDNMGEVAASKVWTYSDNKLLTIKNLIGINRVSVYTILGQLAETAEVSGSVYTKTLPAGTYIVVVSGNSSYRGVVIVK